MLLQGRINSVMFYVLWTCAPISISVLRSCDARQGAYYWCDVYSAFHSFVVSQLEQAIALFNMIRSIVSLDL